MTIRPPASFDVKGTKQTTKMWGDASGESRMLAAVVQIAPSTGYQWFGRG